MQSGLLPVRNDYVECECNRLGEFAVKEDVETGFGWTLSAGLVSVVVVVSYVCELHPCPVKPRVKTGANVK